MIRSRSQCSTSCSYFQLIDESDLQRHQLVAQDRESLVVFGGDGRRDTLRVEILLGLDQEGQWRWSVSCGAERLTNSFTLNTLNSSMIAAARRVFSSLASLTQIQKSSISRSRVSFS